MLALTRHAASRAPERIALAVAIRGLLAALDAPGEHLPACPAARTARCSTSCSEARKALLAARQVLFGWKVQ